MIKKFIKENKIDFSVGQRNSSCVILTGYAQYLELDMYQLEKELEKQIEEDTFIQDEIRRIWDYCKARNYKNYWSTPLAKETYKF
jgi:hypothetical protein